MTILKIYKEDDHNYSNALLSLPYGHHIMGRKLPITTDDSRISRKHALITVHQNGASIEAMHKNPTFIKSSSSGELIKLSKKNEPLPLNNDDSFSLVSKSNWYRVKLIQQKSEETVPFKRRLVENTTVVSPNKRIKIDNVEESCNVASSSTSSSKTDDTVFIRAKDINCFAANELDSSDSECAIKIEPQDNNSSENVTSTNTNQVEVENSLPVEIKLEPPDTTSAETTSTNREEIDNITNTNQQEVENSLPVQIKLEPPDTTSAETTSTNQVEIDNITNTNQLEAENSLPVEVKLEPPDTTSTETTSTNQVEIENNLPVSVKLEPSDSGSTDVTATNQANNNLPVTVKVEPLEANSNNPTSSTSDANVGSSSGTARVPPWKIEHPDWRRDRCWYGSNCFRRNPMHKEDFTHPGDDDYDSDPNDHRLVCVYGQYCYRLNMQHRREFKHYGKPANRPAINLMVRQFFQDKYATSEYESDYDSDVEQ
ncbi:unnamed protein product [Phyllotreta striolata]|uniref:FHA domain-containing protein n=1 Tax=Phyllotreta striolata TaxID=444603 RepID=A0A9N9TR30_PHYSR|nr:unnamed protein product [Phyllotreta striolata]